MAVGTAQVWAERIARLIALGSMATWQCCSSIDQPAGTVEGTLSRAIITKPLCLLIDNVIALV